MFTIILFFVLKNKLKDTATGKTASSSISNIGTTKPNATTTTRTANSLSLSSQQQTEIMSSGNSLNPNSSTSHPPQTPLTKIQPMAGVPNIRKDNRRNSSRFNISKNRELVKLPLLKEAAAN